MDEMKLRPVEEVREEFLRQLEYVSSLEPDSEEYEKAVKHLDMLGKILNALSETEAITEEKHLKYILDEEAQRCSIEREEQQLVEQKKERFWRIVLDTSKIVVPLAFYGVWMYKGFKFEETGTYTSKTFMNLFNRFKPTDR